MRTLLAAAALALAAPLALAQTPAAKPQRLALVIGNAAYREAPLTNPVNDAADMARLLEANGFTVIRRDNATLREMHLALREFGDRLGRQSTGLFYFAGHGMQVRGRNYLIPVDADIAREDEAAFAGLDLGALMEKLDSAKNPANVVILDACRNNPFGNRLSISAKGLAQMEAPPGTLIAFSTAPGSTAADGGGRNGLYTGHLLAQMQKAGTTIEEVLKAVRAAVRKDSAGRQIPWESTSLETEVILRPAPVKTAAAAPAPAPAAGAAARSASPFAPPSFVVGDRWSYRYRNLFDGSEKERNQRVARIDGNDVHWASGEVSDLLGNYTRTKNNEKWWDYSPAAHWYVFPLRIGNRHSLTYEARSGDRVDDNKVTLAVEAEEEIDTPAGRFRAVRVKRTVEWTERGKPANYGGYEATFWYSGAVKKYVVVERNNHHRGKVVRSERQELTSYSVR